MGFPCVQYVDIKFYDVSTDISTWRTN